MDAPEPRARRWARRLQLLCGLLLMLAPALPWARVPLAGPVIWLPGLVFHGVVVMGVGLLATMLVLIRRPAMGLVLVLALVAVVLVAMDVRLIMGRTEYHLDRLQLSIAQATDLLNHLGLTLPRLAPTGWKPQAFVGGGAWACLGASALLGAAAVGEAMTYGPSRPWVRVLLGIPACGRCRARVALDQRFCPACGERLVAGSNCPACAAWMPAGYRFCAACGTSAPTSSCTVSQ